MKGSRILVTGGTGFLGGFLLPLLNDCKVQIFSRSRPECLAGDLTSWDAGLKIENLEGQFDTLIHLAGLYDLRIGAIESLRHNALATHTALALAQKIGIRHVVHASTIAVTINEKGSPIPADQLETSKIFPDNYAMGKAHAEHLVRYWPHTFESRLILRLGILVGDTLHGKINRIDGPYHAPHSLGQLQSYLRLFPGGSIPVPGNEQGSLPIVPVDVAAQAIRRLVDLSFEHQWKGVHAFHLAPRNGIRHRELYESTFRRLKIDKRVHLVQSIPAQISERIAEFLAGFPKEEMEYMLRLPSLDTSNTERFLGSDWCPEFKSYESAFWRGYDEFVSHS